MKNLLAKNPHYIRCIKPNDSKQPLKVDEELLRHQVNYCLQACSFLLTLDQVRYLGLPENLRVRRSGYAFRMDFKRFMDRYKMLSRLTWPSYKGAPRDGIKYILEDGADLSKAEYAFGRSKIFVRNPKSVLQMEDLRRAQTIILATKIQAVFKGWKARIAYQQKRKAQITISSQFRGLKERKKYQAKRNKLIMITSFWRMWKERRVFAKHMQDIVEAEAARRQAIAQAKAAVVITKAVRGWVVRKRMAKYFR